MTLGFVVLSQWFSAPRSIVVIRVSQHNARITGMTNIYFAVTNKGYASRCAGRTREASGRFWPFICLENRNKLVFFQADNNGIDSFAYII